MAQRIIHELVDDLDQTVITDGKGGTIEFAVRGTSYRIDLTTVNARKFEKALAPFVAAATKISSPRRTDGRSARSTRATTAAVRAWARDNGYDVSGRGRVPITITKAYERAQKRSG